MGSSPIGDAFGTHGLVGYDDRFTRDRSRVRSSVGVCFVRVKKWGRVSGVRFHTLRH